MFSATRGRLCSQSWRVHSCGLQISKTTLVQRFQVNWRAFFCLWAFDTVRRLCESKTGLVFHWTNKNPAHSGTWGFEMHGLCIDRRRARRFLKETHAFLSSHWWFLWVDPRSYSHQINAAKWNAPEIILDVCSLQVIVSQTFSSNVAICSLHLKHISTSRLPDVRDTLGLSPWKIAVCRPCTPN